MYKCFPRLAGRRGRIVVCYCPCFGHLLRATGTHTWRSPSCDAQSPAQSLFSRFTTSHFFHVLCKSLSSLQELRWQCIFHWNTKKTPTHTCLHTLNTAGTRVRGSCRPAALRVSNTDSVVWKVCWLFFVLQYLSCSRLWSMAEKGQYHSLPFPLGERFELLQYLSGLHVKHHWFHPTFRRLSSAPRMNLESVYQLVLSFHFA